MLIAMLARRLRHKRDILFAGANSRQRRSYKILVRYHARRRLLLMLKKHGSNSVRLSASSATRSTTLTTATTAPRFNYPYISFQALYHPSSCRRPSSISSLILGFTTTSLFSRAQGMGWYMASRFDFPMPYSCPSFLEGESASRFAF